MKKIKYEKKVAINSAYGKSKTNYKRTDDEDRALDLKIMEYVSVESIGKQAKKA